MSLCHLLGDLAFLGGILMQLNAFLSPVPWFSDKPNNALLQFTRKLESSPNIYGHFKKKKSFTIAYQQPYGYIPPNACPIGQPSNYTIYSANVSQPIPKNEPLLGFRRFADSSPVTLGLSERDTNTANYSKAAIW